MSRAEELAKRLRSSRSPSRTRSELDREAIALLDRYAELERAAREYFSVQDSMKAFYGMPLGGDFVWSQRKRVEDAQAALRAALAKLEG